MIQCVENHLEQKEKNTQMTSVKTFERLNIALFWLIQFRFFLLFLLRKGDKTTAKGESMKIET